MCFEQYAKEISESRDSRLWFISGNLNFNETIGFSEGKFNNASSIR